MDWLRNQDLRKQRKISKIILNFELHLVLTLQDLFRVLLLSDGIQCKSLRMIQVRETT